MIKFEREIICNADKNNIMSFYVQLLGQNDVENNIVLQNLSVGIRVGMIRDEIRNI